MAHTNNNNPPPTHAVPEPRSDQAIPAEPSIKTQRRDHFQHHDKPIYTLDPEDQIVRMEPIQLSDCCLLYSGTTFHVHKGILAQKSKYFDTLFQSTASDWNCVSPSSKRMKTLNGHCVDAHKSGGTQMIEIPRLTTIHNQTVSGDDFLDFLCVLYSNSGIQFADVIGSVVCFSPWEMSYLAHYFQCTHLESQCAEINEKWVDGVYVDPHTKKCRASGIWDTLLEAERYNWKCVYDKLIAKMSEDLDAFEQGPLKTERDQIWKVLNFSTREDLLRASTRAWKSKATAKK